MSLARNCPILDTLYRLHRVRDSSCFADRDPRPKLALRPYAPLLPATRSVLHIYRLRDSLPFCQCRSKNSAKNFLFFAYPPVLPEKPPDRNKHGFSIQHRARRKEMPLVMRPQSPSPCMRLFSPGEGKCPLAPDPPAVLASSPNEGPPCHSLPACRTNEKRWERSRLVAMFVIRSDAVASKKSASVLSPHRKGVGKDTGQGISVFTPDSRNGFRHMAAYSLPCRQCTGGLLAGNL